MQNNILALIFIILLTDIVNPSNDVLLKNQKCMTQPTLINLYPNEYCQGLRCYTFTINLDSK